MNRVVTAMLLVVGGIHLLPAVGMLGAARLEGLYGIPVDEPNLEILLRHRAVLFGILGGLFVVAAFRPALRRVALGAGLVSVVSFLVLAESVGGANPHLDRVAFVDWIALGCLLLGAGALRLSTPGSITSSERGSPDDR
jgi:hypothetical protein